MMTIMIVLKKKSFNKLRPHLPEYCPVETATQANIMLYPPLKCTLNRLKLAPFDCHLQMDVAFEMYASE